MEQPSSTPIIYIVSGGVGASGEQLVNTLTIVDMTDKTIELGADEIIRHLARRFG